MRFILKSLCVMGALSFGVQAGQGEAHQSGQSFASSLVGNVTGAAKGTNPHEVPGFQTDRPQEASLSSGALGEAAFQASKKDEAAQHIISEARDRKSFKIDPDTDPLLVAGNEAIKNPQKVLSEEFVETPESRENKSEEIKTCEESGEETLEEGEERRIVTVEKPKHSLQVYIYSHGWSGGLVRNIITGAKLDGSTSNTSEYAAGTTIYNPLPEHYQSRIKSISFAPSCTSPSYVSLSSTGILSVTTAYGSWFYINGVTVSIDIEVNPGEENTTDVIDSTCQSLEEKVDKGLCSYEAEIIVEGPQTRVINEYAVTRDWWLRKKIYRCHYPARNDCKALRTKGCYQINSECKEKVNDSCVVWEQTYSCPTGKRSLKSFRSSNKSNPYCLTGNCADTSYEANGEMMNVMSQLSALREVQEDLQNCKVIFGGQDRRCTRHCVGFKDCCGPEGGWGVSTKLTECDKDETELRDLRNRNLCVQVGTYCAEKKAGICLRKKTSFCCYGTKMARLIQQNGRTQLGIGFGAPDAPNCSGLSAEELSRIDFSKIDFSEVFEDITSKMVPKGQEQSLAQVSTKRIQENMTLLTKPSLNPQMQSSTQELREKGF